MKYILKHVILTGLLFSVLFSVYAQNIPISGGTALAYTLEYPANMGANYETGMIITFKANVVNGPGVTINVNSLGPRTIKNTAGDNLVANDIKAGQIVTIVYDGTYFQMTTTSGNIVAGGGGSGQWTTNGTDIFYNTGKVGVGIASPTVTLHVFDNSSSFTRGILSDRLFEDANGAQLNLRKARPSGVLSSQDILGELNFIGYFADPFPYRRTAAISARSSETWTTGGNGTYMVFETTPNGTSSILERMRITENGKVGIGITTPTVTLHVADNNLGVVAAQTSSGTNSGAMVILRSRGTITSPAAVGLGDYLGTFGFIGYDAGGNFTNPSAEIAARASESFTSGHGTNLIFRTTPNGSNNPWDRMIISDIGNIGIGTHMPTEKLQVVKNITAGDFSTISIVGGITGEARLALGDTANNYMGMIRYNNNNNSMDFGTNNMFSRLTIDSSGNIGIGALATGVKLNVNGNIKTMGITIPTGAFPGAVLASDASGNGNWASPPGFSNLQVFNSSGIFNIPAGVTKIMIEVWGAGGGGAKSTFSTSCTGAGGGAGGYGKGIFTLTNTASLQVQVGLGGLGGATGGNGGTTCVSSAAACSGMIFISATGGFGGGSGCGAPSSSGGISSAVFNISGGVGNPPSTVGPFSHGGDAPLGGTGGKCGTSGNGFPGTIPGGGGGGGNSSGSNAGDGANGRIVIWY